MPRRNLDNLKLLVAEDNPMNRRVVELLLAQSGVSITFAENGKEAVEKFKAGKYDHGPDGPADADHGRPGRHARDPRSGDERANGKSPTPMHRSVGQRHRPITWLEAKEAGADDHVAKPIVRETLFEVMARHARHSRVGDAPVTLDDGEFDLDEFDVAV